MRVLGITSLQQYVVKQVQLGDSYEQIAEATGETVYEIIHQEMLAYSVLAGRWNKKEVEIRKILSGILLLFLSFVSVFESQILDDQFIERATRTVRTTRVKRREIDDFATLDV